MNFAELSALTIPEGSVVKIACGDEVLWQKSTSALPSEYQQVEYVVFTGTQGCRYKEAILDTTGLELVFSLSQFSAQYISGAYTGASVKPFLTGRVSGSGRAIDFYTGSVSIRSSVLVLDTVYAMTLAADIPNLTASISLEQDGENQCSNAMNIPSPDLSQVFSFGIGCNGYLLNNGYDGLYGRIYSLRHKSNGTLVRDFVPCYRKEDGAIGFYDIVQGEFFENVGTGSFTCGADV